MINTTNTTNLSNTARLDSLGSHAKQENNKGGISNDAGASISVEKSDKYTKSSSHELRMAELRDQISDGEYDVDLSSVSEKMTKLIKGE